MGMAASQARFLQLTARKTNLEYMGQQINQERLALANESAGLFERQLTMDPPTPPSSLDDTYYTPAYTFVDPSDGIQKKIQITLNSQTNPTAISSVSVSYHQYQPDGTYAENTTFMAGTNMTEVWTGNQVSSITAGTGAADTWFYDNSFTTANQDQFVDLATGRMKKLVIAQTDASAADTWPADQIHTVDLTYSPEFDEDAFNDDMNEYEYKKATYDYEIERINLETERIQKQDKSLELKMKQIDTEHKAISTEIDAVQKVIQKGIDSTFKTFS